MLGLIVLEALVFLDFYVVFLCDYYLLNVSLFYYQDEKFWTLMPPLPSYGYGRERPGPRYGSLIHGQNLKDVVITGL